jgi:hypothetical protein
MPLDKLTLNVHRRPIAEFSFTLARAGTNYNISLQDSSYDLDHQVSRSDKGIIAEEWKWKEASATTWTTGKPTSLQGGKEYLVSLRVKDPEGVLSNPNVKLVAPGKNLPPIAAFTLHPDPLPLGDTLSYQDYSYDPNGYPLTEWAWRYKRPNGIWVNSGNIFPSNVYSSLGIYEVELKVKNSLNLWSEPYYQNFFNHITDAPGHAVVARHLNASATGRIKRAGCFHPYGNISPLHRFGGVNRPLTPFLRRGYQLLVGIIAASQNDDHDKTDGDDLL